MLHMNVDRIISAQTVEQGRVEYKATLDTYTKPAIVETICAFANDLFNYNGGYVIIGIEAPDSRPILPPRGIDEPNLERYSQELRVALRNIDPPYSPIVETVKFMDKHLIVVYAPGGDNKPYSAPSKRKPEWKWPFVRINSETVKAEGEHHRQLMQQAAKIPFDDRRNLAAKVADISSTLVRRYLENVKSSLIRMEPMPSDEQIYATLRLTDEYNQLRFPKNVALMMFNEKPKTFFQCCRVEVAQYSDDSGGNKIEERVFDGPVDEQISSILSYLNSLVSVQLEKVAQQAEVEKSIAFPYEAMEEAIANAVFHRSYEENYEPNKIHLYPDRLEIISYPGPVPGVKMEHFTADRPVPPFPARNRRLGDFLKELKLIEMRGTGIPKIKAAMHENGSAEPAFDFDDASTYFRVVLPAHPKYRLLGYIREASYLWSIGEKNKAIELVAKAYTENKGSGAMAGLLIEYLSNADKYSEATTIFEEFVRQPVTVEAIIPYLKLIRMFLYQRQDDKAKETLRKIPADAIPGHEYEIGLAYKRVKDLQNAHIYLAASLRDVGSNPEALRDIAKVKSEIANREYRRRPPNWPLIKRLRKECLGLLRKAISLSTDNNISGWCYFDMAMTLRNTDAPPRDVEDAFVQSKRLLGNQPVVDKEHQAWKQKSNGRR